MTGRIQLVWDSGSAGTAQTDSGHCLDVGSGEKWTPDQLLLIAAESSIMTVFLRLAEERKLEVLGYVSSAGAVVEDGERGIQVVVRPCVVVAGEGERARAKELIAKAVAQSPIARALSKALRVDAEVVAESSSTTGSPRPDEAPP